jgi:hypothetical protein
MEFRFTKNDQEILSLLTSKYGKPTYYRPTQGDPTEAYFEFTKLRHAQILIGFDQYHKGFFVMAMNEEGDNNTEDQLSEKIKDPGPGDFVDYIEKYRVDKAKT